MRYKPNLKMGGLLLLLLTVLFVMLMVSKQGELFASGSAGWTQALLLLLVYLLGVGLIYWKYWLLRAVRLEEQEMVLERLFLPDLHLPFDELRVSYRGAEKRSAAGLMLERGEGHAPQFVLLAGFAEEEADKLRAALAERLGYRYREESEGKRR